MSTMNWKIVRMLKLEVMVLIVEEEEITELEVEEISKEEDVVVLTKGETNNFIPSSQGRSGNNFWDCQSRKRKRQQLSRN